MQRAIKFLIIVSTFTLFFVVGLRAQTIYVDSLERLLTQKDLPKESKVVILCQLAKANFEKDLPKSFRQTKQALQLGEQLKDGRGKALAYATRIYLYVQQKDMDNAYQSLDSALYYAERTSDPIAKGFVWLRNGWLDIVNDENDKSIVKLLKALDFFKGRQADEYEATVYHYLASFYGYGNDPSKQAEYAQLCYNSAIKSKQVDVLNIAYFTVGQSYYDRFKLDTANRSLLDSALAYNKQSIRLSTVQAGRLLVQSNTAGVALNIANSYFQHFPIEYKDSAEKYIDIAVGIASKTNLQEVLLNCYGIRSEYALREGNYDEAEKILLTGLAAQEGSVVKMPGTKARIFLALSRVAEKKGAEKTALSYLNKYIQFNKEAFDEEKINSIQRVEARYRTEKKEQEIAYLQQQATFNKKRNVFYLILGASGLVVLLLLLSSYNYKLKASIRKQKLIDKEKKEAELKAQLKEAEANQLHTEQILLKERQERLQKELLAGTLQIEEKNDLLELLSDKITSQSHLPVDEQIKRILNQQKRMDKDFEGHKTDFFEIDPLFF